MPNKYLILKGCAGLGNRLSTLASAIEYARKNKRILYVDWSDGQFGCKKQNIFYKYFELKNVDYIRSINEIADYNKCSCYPPFWGENPSASLYDIYIHDYGNTVRKFIPLSFCGNLSKPHSYWRRKRHEEDDKTGSDIRALKSLFNKNDIPFGGRYKNNRKEDILFFADHIPEFLSNIIRENIFLTNEINTEINNIANNLGLSKNCIGVHVRMTDKQPVASLNKLADKLVGITLEAKLHSPKLFIATDSEAVENYFKEHFNNVFFTEKWRPDKSGKEMGIHQYAIRSEDYTMAERMLKESIIDMWLLSKCEYLVWQSNSTFSKIASILKYEPEKTLSW
ncbi:MAG: hypothetical protein LBV47_03880 [Bacteroidales bacterium]|jgi:hypothetical protein|nr:hypothetical protein [Bacteroidales bacterium]